MKSTKYNTHSTLAKLIKANSDKRSWAESLLGMVRSAKNSRGENRIRELVRMEADITEKLNKDYADRQLQNHTIEVNRDFVELMQHRHPDLTENELLLSCLLLMDVPAETIASLKGTSMASLNVARSRLKNKLGIEAEQNLDEYLKTL